MAIRKLEKDDFVYIVFRRSSMDDTREFEKMLNNLVKNDNRDIIVDLTVETSLTESEIALIAGVAKQLQGTPRCLRIIATHGIYKRFDNNNLAKADNVVLYKYHEDHAELLEGLDKEDTSKDTVHADT